MPNTIRIILLDDDDMAVSSPGVFDADGGLPPTLNSGMYCMIMNLQN